MNNVVICGKVFLGFLLAAGFCGCGSQTDRESKPAPIPTVPSSSSDAASAEQKPGNASSPSTGDNSATAPTELKFDGIQFTLPAGWKKLEIPPEKQGFIDAQIGIPAEGEELTLTLSSVGGGIEANIARWKSQFAGGETPPVVETLDLGGREATWVDLHGEFRAGVGQQREPQSNQRMLGVGIPLEPRDFYLKLVGPAETVEKVREAFRQFVQTARFSP